MTKKILYTLLIAFAWNPLQAQTTIERSTETFAVKDADTLQLDFYQTKSTSDTTKPTIIFVFGGGFIAGHRGQPHNVLFCKKMAEQGFNVAAIDYRLGFLKAFGSPRNKISFQANLKKYKPVQFLGLFDSCIQMAMEDMFDATTYLLKNANRLHIDTSKILATGSSAGAITVLEGENNIVNNSALAQNHLPPNFNYAGIISMAGAIFQLKNDVQWQRKPAPILFFHGDADRNVPYDKVRIKVLFFPLPFGFYGSKHIATQLKKMNAPYWFYRAENVNHIMAISPMQNNINEMLHFYNDFVVSKKDLQIETKEKNLQLPNVKKKFGFADYLKGNFGK